MKIDGLTKLSFLKSQQLIVQQLIVQKIIAKSGARVNVPLFMMLGFIMLVFCAKCVYKMVLVAYLTFGN
ncbi:hypothetical protein MOMA_03780 [Moraxella macacae 0408225]|uniref:Uncharacterized protein n=1 Tax=Moraxella macacae 0408225 TaxID=1230338 RepID=L2F8X9_9GAMM|nr:hypothetical protein MOMA_03780 [Moraxella macacae 0408225]